jgi:hypothetical protein
MNLTDTIKGVQRKIGVDADGAPGEQTWTAIAQALGLVRKVATIPVSTLSSNTPIGDKLAAIAESQIGTQEDAQHQNRGSAILKYQEATNLGGQGWPWCAAFVDWCLLQLSRMIGMQFTRPQTASAFGLIDWGKEQNLLVFAAGSNYDPKRGDLVVYNFSHCGIVADVDLAGKTFHALEGNSNIDGSRDGYEVVRHARNFDSVRQFIRLA